MEKHKRHNTIQNVNTKAALQTRQVVELPQDISCLTTVGLPKQRIFLTSFSGYKHFGTVTIKKVCQYESLTISQKESNNINRLTSWTESVANAI